MESPPFRISRVSRRMWALISENQNFGTLILKIRRFLFNDSTNSRFFTSSKKIRFYLLIVGARVTIGVSGKCLELNGVAALLHQPRQPQDVKRPAKFMTA